MDKAERQLKKLFKKLDNPAAQPTSEWLASARSEIQQHIRANQPSVAEHFEPEPLPRRSWFVRPVGVLASILIAILAIGGGTTYAAQGAEPGDTLYPLKLAGENFSVFVNVSPESKAKLYLKYADRRMEELEKLYEKEPENEYWQEKVVQKMGEQVVSAKDSMAQLEEEPEFADIALEFDLFTEKQDQQISELQAHLNTTTSIINRAQELNEINKSKALEALEKAQEVIGQNQAMRESVKQKVNARLELLRARQKTRLEEKNKKSGKGSIKVQFNGEELEFEDKDSDNSAKEYEVEMEEDGLHFESEIEIESEGNEDVETIIDINGGQTIIKSNIQATGTSIIINESSNLIATSSSSVEVRGQMTDWREKFFKDFQDKFGDFKFSGDKDDKDDKNDKDRNEDKDD